MQRRADDLHPLPPGPRACDYFNPASPPPDGWNLEETSSGDIQWVHGHPSSSSGFGGGSGGGGHAAPRPTERTADNCVSSLLQALFKENRADLDEAIPSDEWGRIVYEQEELCTKYFGDATPDEIAAQFLNLDDSAQSSMAFEQFVDGVMSLGLAVSLAHALETPEGAEDLK